MPAESMSLYLLDDTRAARVVSQPRRRRGPPSRSPMCRPRCDRPSKRRGPSRGRCWNRVPDVAQARSGVYTALRARGQRHRRTGRGSRARRRASRSSTSRSSTGSPRRSASRSTTPACSAGCAPSAPTRSAAGSRATSTTRSAIRWPLGFELDRAQAVAERGEEFAPMLRAARAPHRGDQGGPRDALRPAHRRHRRARSRHDHPRAPHRSRASWARHRAPRRRHRGAAAASGARAVAVARRSPTSSGTKADLGVLFVYTVTPVRARLEIADDGVGYTGAVRTDRYGMVGMRERVDSIGAQHITLRCNTQRGAWVLGARPMEEVMG